MTNAVNNLTHILVVDDEKELADVLELYLTNDGYMVHKCYTGTEALDCIEHINSTYSGRYGRRSPDRQNRRSRSSGSS